MTDENVPDVPSRRNFLKNAAAGAALVATPAWTRERTGIAAGLPLDELARIASEMGPEDEAFWEIVKGQFPLRPGLILVNAANLCPSPYPVQETVFRLTRDVDQDASFQNRGKFGRLKEESREALARYLGASVDEIAITRNTSESNNTVLNGLKLGPDDEVVIWDQNHPTNLVSWEVRAERWGFGIRKISTPPRPTTEDELVAAFEAAITDRTRVIAFSHISNVTGVAQPAQRLCTMAREAGIASHVDGAQSFGVVQVDLHAMGCDFYTGSAHKWFVGPKECGVLYVRKDRVAELWPSDVGVGWAGALASGGASKFDNYGQRDDAAVAAVATTVAFHEAIGPAAVEARTRALASGLKTRVRDRVPEVEFHTSDVPERSGGVVVVMMPTDDHGALFNRLYEEHQIAGAPRGGDYPGVRLCPHMYNTMEEMDRIADALAASI